VTGGVGKRLRCRAYVENGGVRPFFRVMHIRFGEEEECVAERIYYGTT
jgi:hypothetical protein